MSDAIREAFEKWWLIEMGHTIHDQRSGDGYFPSDADASWEAWQAALQSQTAPAVPSVVVPELGGEPPVTILGVLSSYARPSLKENGVSDEQVDAWFQGLKKLLTAAPQPDHSGYTSEVADDLPGMWDQSDLSGGETDVRPPKHHTLKTDPAVYDRSAMGRKPWEIRLNDRDYQVGDTVTLQETKHSGAEMQQGAPLEFTGNEITGQITYVLRGPKYGLADGWCIFSVEPNHIADAGKVVPGLSFRALREANAERINSSKYEQCERHWTPAHWMQATVGELGELANLLKKVDRGDFPFDQVKDDVARELADVQTYLDILALKLGVDLGQATIDKFNEVSERIGSHVTLTATPSVPEEEAMRKLVQALADEFREAWPDHTGKHAWIVGAGYNLSKAILRTAGDDGEGA